MIYNFSNITHRASEFIIIHAIAYGVGPFHVGELATCTGGATGGLLHGISRLRFAGAGKGALSPSLVS